MASLIFKKSYGTNAQSIYDFCCSQFPEWEKSLKNKFGMYSKLYAENVDTQGLDVWFIAHSNLNGSHSKHSKPWDNEIDIGKGIIKQNASAPSDDVNKAISKRVVFAHDGSQYIFIGVYAKTWADIYARKDKYERISETYPY